MSYAIRAGLVLGALVVAWTLVMGFTGWYRDPAMAPLFFFVVILQIVVLVMVLRRTAKDGEAWAGQVKVGLVTSLVASGIIFAGSLLFTIVLFPSYFEDIRAGHRDQLARSGMSDADIDRTLAETPRPSPLGQAVAGVAGTLITGLFVSAIAGVFLRRRDDEPRP